MKPISLLAVPEGCSYLCSRPPVCFAIWTFATWQLASFKPATKVVPIAKNES